MLGSGSITKSRAGTRKGLDRGISFVHGYANSSGTSHRRGLAILLSPLSDWYIQYLQHLSLHSLPFLQLTDPSSSAILCPTHHGRSRRSAAPKVMVLAGRPLLIVASESVGGDHHG